MPQGGIDPEKTPRAAAFRGLKEETGVVNAEILAESRLGLAMICRRNPRKSLEWALGVAAQKWFAMRFKGGMPKLRFTAMNSMIGNCSECGYFVPYRTFQAKGLY